MSLNPLLRLGQLGQSPWYDYLTRDLLRSGELRRLVERDGLQGVTSNPTIFEKAIAGTDLYDDQIEREAGTGAAAAEVLEALTITDIRGACDVLAQLFESSEGRRGHVSLELPPALAYDAEGSVAAARRLWGTVDRPNLLLKIPGTREGLPAVERCLAEGININITLLFSVARYQEVVEAFLRALELRASRGDPLSQITSVASFFVSRVDAKVDALLERQGDPSSLRSTIAIANAWTAYAAFRRTLESSRWERLARGGARPQRPLWASTRPKDPRTPAIHYVDALVAPDTVSTMPPDTWAAYRDHGEPRDRSAEGMEAAPGVLAALEERGVDLREVTRELEEEGVRSFAASHAAAAAAIEATMASLQSRGSSAWL